MDIIGSGLLSMGGVDGGNNFFAAAYRAAIKSDGTITNYGQLSSNSLNNNRAFSTPVAIGNYLWILGGEYEDSQNNVVPINISESSQLR